MDIHIDEVLNLPLDVAAVKAAQFKVVDGEFIWRNYHP
jgi:hypothetical protein